MAFVVLVPRAVRCFVVVLLVVSINAFSKAPISVRNQLAYMAVEDICVVGVAGGVGESVVCRLLQEGGENSMISGVFDRRPYSPILLEAAKANKIRIYTSDFDKDQLIDLVDERIKSFPDVLEGRLVVAVNDDGDQTLRGADQDSNSESGLMLTRLLKALNPSVKGFICATSAESDKSGGGIE